MAETNVFATEASGRFDMTLCLRPRFSHTAWGRFDMTVGLRLGGLHELRAVLT